MVWSYTKNSLVEGGRRENFLGGGHSTGGRVSLLGQFLSKCKLTVSCAFIYTVEYLYNSRARNRANILYSVKAFPFSVMHISSNNGNLQLPLYSSYIMKVADNSWKAWIEMPVSLYYRGESQTVFIKCPVSIVYWQESILLDKERKRPSIDHLWPVL